MAFVNVHVQCTVLSYKSCLMYRSTTSAVIAAIASFHNSKNNVNYVALTLAMSMLRVHIQGA
jgi:hypothetical protein